MRTTMVAAVLVMVMFSAGVGVAQEENRDKGVLVGIQKQQLEGDRVVYELRIRINPEKTLVFTADPNDAQFAAIDFEQVWLGDDVKFGWKKTDEGDKLLWFSAEHTDDSKPAGEVHKMLLEYRRTKLSIADVVASTAKQLERRTEMLTKLQTSLTQTIQDKAKYEEQLKAAVEEKERAHLQAQIRALTAATEAIQKAAAEVKAKYDAVAKDHAAQAEALKAQQVALAAKIKELAGEDEGAKLIAEIDEELAKEK